MKYFKPFEAPVAPTFPDLTVDIRDYGAVEGGETPATDAIRAAIEDCSKRGGGRVVVPEGRWLTGPIHLRDNVNLHFAKGALVEFSTNFYDYLPVVYGILAGNRVYSVSHFLYAYQCKNIAVTGEGILDGHGEAWWHMKHHQPGMEDLMKKGKALAPMSERVYDKPEDGVRPRMLQFVECENVLLEGITLKNSPSWTVHLAWCKNIIVRKVITDNPLNAPNTDGINMEYCKRALMEECCISGGDDMCCIKAGRDADAWEYGVPCEDVEIRNCRAIACKGGGVTIGSETGASIRNIWLHDCYFERVCSGLNMKTIKGRGGVVENIDVENIEVELATRDAIRINMRYTGEPLDDYSQPDHHMPVVRNFYVNNFVCHKSPRSITICGVKNHEIENVTIRNATIRAEEAALIEGVRGLSLDNVKILQES